MKLILKNNHNTTHNMIFLLLVTCGFILPVPLLSKTITTGISTPSISALFNSTRKDIVDDFIGFAFGAIVADNVIESMRFCQQIQKNISLQNAFNALDAFSATNDVSF